MSDDLLERLRANALDECDEAIDRIEALEAERERLALAICGGEDVPGYANAQTVESLEKVARDNVIAAAEQINRTLALTAEHDALKANLEAAGKILEECRPFVGYEANVDDLLSEIDATLAKIKGEADD